MSKKDEILAQYMDESEKDPFAESDVVLEDPSLEDTDDDETSFSSEDEEESTDTSEEQVETDELDAGDALLEGYGFEGGVLEWEGEEIKFSEATPEIQKEILLELINQNSIDDTEDTPAIPENELEAYQQFKALQENGTLESILNGESINNGEDKTFHQMDDEEIFRYDYLDSIPEKTLNEMSDEEIEDLLQSEYEKAKDSTTFSLRMDAKRDKFVEQEESYYEQENARKLAEQQALYEQQVQMFKERANDVNQILVSDVTPEDKEELYSKILEVDEDGVSQFVKDIHASPEEALKAAFLYYKGQSMIDEIQDYFVNKIQEERNSAKRALSGNENDDMGSRLKSSLSKNSGSSDPNRQNIVNASDVSRQRLSKIKI